MGGRASDEILTDDVDLAFGVFEEVPQTINQKHLCEDSFVCVVSADHPRVGKTISLDRYIELPHLEVLPAPNARPSERIDRILTAKGLRRRVTMRVPYFSVAAQIVSQSDHVHHDDARLCRGARPKRSDPLPKAAVRSPATAVLSNLVSGSRWRSSSPGVA